MFDINTDSYEYQQEAAITDLPSFLTEEDEAELSD